MAHLVVIRFQLNSAPADGPGKFWYATGMFAQKHVDPNGYVQQETGNMFTWAAKPDRKNSTIFFVHNIYNDLNRMDSLVELPVQFRQLVSALVYQGPGTMGDLPAPSDLGWKEWTPGEETKSPSAEEKIPNVEEAPKVNDEVEEIDTIMRRHTIPLEFLYLNGFFERYCELDVPRKTLAETNGMMIIGYVVLSKFFHESGKLQEDEVIYVTDKIELFTLNDDEDFLLGAAMLGAIQRCKQDGGNVRDLWFKIDTAPCPFSEEELTIVRATGVKAIWAK